MIRAISSAYLFVHYERGIRKSPPFLSPAVFLLVCAFDVCELVLSLVMAKLSGFVLVWVGLAEMWEKNGARTEVHAPINLQIRNFYLIITWQCSTPVAVLTLAV